MTGARGLLIAAPRSGSGKTTVMLGVLRALTRRGLCVRGLKCGPDYIDPAFHAAATGAPSFNVDSFAMNAPLLMKIAGDTARNADLIIAEGSMGLFDGVRQETGRTGASADIAAIFGWPVVLVLDVSGHAQSAAAVALGCAGFDPRIKVQGVILNNVASERHRRLVEDGMVRVGLPVIGALMRNAGLALPERHLGLVQAAETDELEAKLEKLANSIDEAIDLERLVALAQPIHTMSSEEAQFLTPPGQRIALASDQAFSFIYPHVIAGWRAAGAEIVPFSPLADEPPPSGCDSCWLPGGYPELHADRISNAQRFLTGLRHFAAERPIHGECGGYMVLGRTMEDGSGHSHEMAGLLPVETSYAKRKLHLGYRVARLLHDGPLGRAGQCLVGHEFHYASVTASDTARTSAFATITDAEDSDLGTAGHRSGHVTGSFFHVIAPR